MMMMVKPDDGDDDDGSDLQLFSGSPGGELFMQLEKEGIFMEDTAW